jgi:hypothetical protein
MESGAVSYPQVLGEFETVERLLQGWSIQRHGDGELKIMDGKGYSREPVNPSLTKELREAFHAPAPGCLIGIPTMDPKGPKHGNWIRHQARFESLLNPDEQYVSAFITRPDSAPWINCMEYARAVEQLWAGKRVVVVCEKSGSMVKTVRKAAKRALHVACPRHEAYRLIGHYEETILAYAPDIAILSAGPTASCLANRLARVGLHAIDLGSAGGFLGRFLL